MVRDLFPLGKVKGKAFCNRHKELKLLIGNIQNVKHTLLVAPRRYGKSSLAEKAIDQASIASIKANFHLCTSAEEVAELIKECVIQLIADQVGKLKAVYPRIEKYLKTLQPRLSFFKDKVSLELISDRKTNYGVVIQEALSMLDQLLAEKDKQAVVFFDEFQEITKISRDYKLEGAIRTAAQDCQQLAFIFSGSIRSLLLNMFEDEARPLYKLCRKIHLGRISASDYETHIQQFARTTWGKPMPDKALNRIFECSNRHPYYLNYLCDTLWQLANGVPTVNDVNQAWHQVLEEEWGDAMREIASLSMAQRRILKYIAGGVDVEQLTSRQASLQLKLAPSSISTAVNSLVERDYIERNQNNHYEILNPLLKEALLWSSL